VDGIDQVVQLMAASVFAVNPLNGDLAWYVKHDAPYGLNVSTPVWGAGNSYLSPLAMAPAAA
jgi:hypothetical protein